MLKTTLLVRHASRHVTHDLETDQDKAWSVRFTHGEKSSRLRGKT